MDSESSHSKGIWQRLFGCLWKKSGTAVGAAGKMTGKAVGAVGNGIKVLFNSMINTTRFITNTRYRRETGYPWIRGILRDNWHRVGHELGESKEMMKILWKYSHGKPITPEQAKAAKEQLYDIMRLVPALAIFALPGGALLLPLLARALPWDLMPSSFRKEVTEEYGAEALCVDLKPGEDVPTDDTAAPPEDLAQTAQEIARAVEQMKTSEPEEAQDRSNSGE